MLRRRTEPLKGDRGSTEKFFMGEEGGQVGILELEGSSSFEGAVLLSSLEGTV